ncbi:hypothetical protein ADU90_12935 [Clostridium botulinum]|uniref:hypothetical protein n=1 Tax=Clostridium botulinum TaxID=1491 RepID=UPI0006A405DD|nr:hypothetical protein [Clostridium botulinum]KOC53756.1 hypothetical protein ADU90_12935 [Clostridium botulinum]KOC55476.1 hypothetical protein ADU89_05205 [Clostridium botulinum]
MKKKIYLLLAIVMATIVLSACSSKENQKNKDFDNVRKKIENNKSSSNTYNSTSRSSSIVKNNVINPERIKELTDFEKRIKDDNDILKKAYKEKIDMKKSSTDIMLQEKFKIAMQRIAKGLKKSKDKSNNASEKQKKEESIKEEFKKLSETENKKYEDNKNALKKIFEDYDNKLKAIESRRDAVIQAMISQDTNTLEIENKDDKSKISNINSISENGKKELKKYKDDINAVVKLRNNELIKIK